MRVIKIVIYFDISNNYFIIYMYLIQNNIQYGNPKLSRISHKAKRTHKIILLNLLFESFCSQH